MRNALLLVLLTASTAAADSKRQDGAWDFGAGMRANAMRDSNSEDTGAVGGELVLGYQLASGTCRTLELTQSGQWYWRDRERGFGSSGGAEICIDDVVDDQGKLWRLPRITTGYRVDTAMRPRLDAPRTLKVDDYGLYSVHFDFGVYEQRTRDRRIAVARIETRGEVTLQGPSSFKEPSRGLLTLGFAAFAHERTGEHAPRFEIARVGLRAEQINDLTLFDAVPFSFADWRAGAMRVGGRAGYTYAHAGTRRMHVPTGAARIDLEVAGVTTSLRYERGVLASVEPIVLVEDRVAIEARRALLGGTIAASGFAAHSFAASTTDAMLDRRDVTGGGTLAFTRPFVRHLAWYGLFEVGRSFYARFDGGSQGAPETVVRASTGLEARFGKR